MDVKTAFLNENLDEEVFIDQLESFMVERKEYIMYKLKRSIYGLKQASNNGIVSLMITSHLLVLKKKSLVDVYT